MEKRIRIFAMVMAVPAGLISLTLAVFHTISPRSAGREIAQKLGIPYQAVIAHRGLSYWAPEATRPAYLMAREIGADYLELDVQRTKDGVLIALHDDDLSRTTNIADVFPDRRSGTVDQFTFLELEKLDAGTWFNKAHPERARPTFAGLRILRLDDVLEIAAGGKNRPGIYLETKSAERYPGYEKAIVETLAKRGWMTPPGRLIFQSFVDESLVRLRELAPSVPRVLLIDRAEVKKLGWQHFLDKAKMFEAGIGPSGYEAWPWFTGPAHREGRLVHVYTINASWQFRLLRQFGVDGVFTDRADLGLELAGRGKSDREAVFKAIGF